MLLHLRSLKKRIRLAKRRSRLPVRHSELRILRALTDLHTRGYEGPFTLDFGGPDVRAQWRDRFADLLEEVAREN